MPRPEPSRIPSSVRLRRYNVAGSRQEDEEAGTSHKPHNAAMREEPVIPPRHSSRRRRGAIENLIFNEKRDHNRRSSLQLKNLPHSFSPAKSERRDGALPSSGQRAFPRATEGARPEMPALEEVVSPRSPGNREAQRIPNRDQQRRRDARVPRDEVAESRDKALQQDPAYRETIHVPFGSHSRYPTADQDPYDQEHHADQVADYLDVVDSEVGTLSYLSNIQNSIFVPPIPRLYDRRPSHSIPSSRIRSNTVASQKSRRGSKTSLGSKDGLGRQGHPSNAEGDLELGEIGTGFPNGPASTSTQSQGGMLSRMSSRVSAAMGMRKPEEASEYDKHIREWRDMDDEERNELDEHIKLVLRKGSKFRRTLKGFYAFVKTPMGFIMTLYGLLITFWGTAIMLFIFNWIKTSSPHERRYWIEICDQILCALFACVGLGFAPFRAVDTYRMIHIARLHHATWERRKKLGLTELRDPNDLPRPEEGAANQVRKAPTEGAQKPGLRIGRALFPHRNKSDTRLHARNSLLSRAAGINSSSGGSERLLGSANESETQTSKLEARAQKIVQRDFIPPVKWSELEVPRAAHERMASSQASSSELGKPMESMKRNDSIQSELVKEREDIVVLTAQEQELLEHHQRKFHASHTFYRFHETATHRAFPLDLMITIVCLLDCHSLLQAALGGCTWGIRYQHRPTALTAALISCSLSCNATAGLLIYIGGRKTKKREEVERRLHLALEQLALDKIERRRARGELADRSHGPAHQVHYRSSDGLRMGLDDIHEHVEGHGEEMSKKGSKSTDHDGGQGSSSNDLSPSDSRETRSNEEHSDSQDDQDFNDAVDAAATYTDQQEYTREHSGLW